MNTAVTSLNLTPAATASATAGQASRSWFARAGAAIWSALQASGQARARAHLLEFADRCELQQPELAKELRYAAGRGPMA